MEDHIFQYLRSDEFRETRVSNTEHYDNWLSSGAPDAVKNARKIVDGILKKGNTNKLNDDIAKKMSEVIRQFEAG